MVSVVWRGRAIPLYWHLMENLGNSDYAEQTALLSQALPLLADYTVVVLGDREFCSVDLARWLGEQGHYFCLRQKRCVYVKTSEHAAWQSLGTLGLSPGTQCFFNTVTLTKSKGFGKAHLAGKWKRRYRGFAPEEPWFILTNFDALDEAIRAYQKRFDIEMCQPQYPHRHLTDAAEEVSLEAVFRTCIFSYKVRNRWLLFASAYFRRRGDVRRSPFPVKA